MRKGYLYAITTVFLLMTAVLLMESFVARQNDANSLLYIQLLGTKIFYTWEDVDEDISDSVQLHIEQFGDMVVFSDTLPYQGAEDFVGNYGSFLNAFYKTPDLEIKFLSPSGQEVDLSSLDSVIRIMPMNISYEYPDFGKNRLFIKANSSDAIDSLNITLKLRNAFFNCDTSGIGPDRCNKWTPDNTVSSCSGIASCLSVNLTVIDANGISFLYPEHFFDITGSKKSSSNLNLINSTSSYSISIQFGPMNQDTIMNIDLHNVVVDSLVGFNLDTTGFFVQYMSKLMVNSSAFNTYKVDWI